MINGQCADLTDIKIVGKPISDSIMVEFAVIDCDGPIGGGRSKQALLIIVKVIIVEDEIAGLITDPGSIPIAYLCPGEYEVVDRVVPSGDKHSLAIRDLLGANHIHHTADA